MLMLKISIKEIKAKKLFLILFIFYCNYLLSIVVPRRACESAGSSFFIFFLIYSRVYIFLDPADKPREVGDEISSDIA